MRSRAFFSLFLSVWFLTVGASSVQADATACCYTLTLDTFIEQIALCSVECETASGVEECGFWREIQFMRVDETADCADEAGLCAGARVQECGEEEITGFNLSCRWVDDASDDCELPWDEIAACLDKVIEACGDCEEWPVADESYLGVSFCTLQDPCCWRDG